MSLHGFTSLLRKVRENGHSDCVKRRAALTLLRLITQPVCDPLESRDVYYLCSIASSLSCPGAVWTLVSLTCLRASRVQELLAITINAVEVFDAKSISIHTCVSG
jgi:hypothetical protein